MEKGDVIKIDYIGRLESGEIFDLTDEELAKKENIYNRQIRYRPVPLVVGGGFVIPGLDKALLGMELNEKKTVEIEPEEGFGKRNPDLVKVVPRKSFGDKDPKPGMVVDFSGLKGRVQSVSAGRVMVDFNNPLAGKKLVYELEIKEKVDDEKEKIKCIFDFFGIENPEIKISNNVLDVETVKLPPEIKEKISSILLENIKPEGKPLMKIRFIESYEKK